MGDMQHFIEDGNRIFEWWGVSDQAVADYEPWQKSWVKGATFLDIWIVGNGGGGGGGFTKTVGNAGGGGGGGGAGNMMFARFLLDTFPETVYFYLPNGAPGGAAGSASGSGPTTSARCALFPNNTNLLINCGGSTAAAQPGSAAGGGIGGVTGTTGNFPVNGLAVSLNSLVGVSSFAGGAPNAVGTNAVNSTGGMLTGGAGGAGSTSAGFAGGSATANGQTAAGGVAGGGEGAPGVWIRDNPMLPWTFTGGGGGGSTNTAATAGGKGGDGAPGCGGGGGGAGVSVAGAGGKGGPAWMLLIAS